MSEPSGPPSDVARRPVGAAETASANRLWWDGEADGYHAEHGAFLGDTDFVWGPERLREADAGLLGELAGADVLEVGAGSGQCSRWVRGRGGRVVATDLSAGMLRTGRRVDAGLPPGARVPFVQCDGRALPFADASFDVVFTAYGVVPFVADPDLVLREAARVLRPGGRFVFSTTHPLRWALPDDPGEGGLTVTMSYFDRTPYVEQDEAGRVVYVEHHRTLGDRVREITTAGLVLVDLVEPEWPEGHEQTWGGWSPLRGRLVPGTAVFVCRRPDAPSGRADGGGSIGS
ncbi:class I SAM-dependent methyltransferase [Terracoccus luteus]|uniref:SAM-dependent methyltransferase n=1 Tax=Terracoccus luteus TaxID=53356 RepID=A0A839PXF8_9MICO|nr:class I SAM-dependent methyltransferase [Terracoccus luteus]MBB2987773.1 SAM-dependent methyltransferase [Terracoccus luteus]MCP2173424.1 SAM-dependent methyltransferase [Terracoccus luteus]